MTISLLSCDTVGMEPSNFTKPQLKKHMNYQPASGRRSSQKIENRPNVFSNEVRVYQSYMALSGHIT